MASVSASSKERSFVLPGATGRKNDLVKDHRRFSQASKGSILFDEKPIHGFVPEKVSLMGIRYVFQIRESLVNSR